jgi:hypothetical protein
MNKFLATILVTIAFTIGAYTQTKELTCKLPGNSAQLDINEGASTAHWHGGLGASDHTRSAVFTSDMITWKYAEKDSQGTDVDYSFTLNRMTGVLWMTESFYSAQFHRNVFGTTSWDCSISKQVF